MPKKFYIFLIFLGFMSSLYAATTGKIVGKVTDAATGEPLPGVNVLITSVWWEGVEIDLPKKIGAATDADGNFVLLNVEPGEYTLVFRMIGYSEYVVKNVVVKIDLTTRIDVALKEEAVKGEEVVVVAERPIVVKDISNSQMNIEAKTIETLPVNHVNDVLSLQAGVELSSNGVVIRGGGPDQTVFLLDGLSLNDERSNIPFAAINLSAVQEIKVQTGGFNAEYGNIRSGLVNVVTKEGDPKRYSVFASLQYAPPQDKHFGISPYDPYSYFNRPYMDTAVCWDGTDNGAWDEYTRGQYPHFEGWKTISEKTLQDDDPTNDLTPEQAKRLYEWQHRRDGTIDKPDYVLDFGFGGPVPVISKKMGNLRFYFSYYDLRDMFVFPLSKDSYSENHLQLKLTSDITPSIKLTLTGLYGEVHSVSPYNWTTTPTGTVLRTVYSVADLLNSSNGNSILYTPAYFSPAEIYRSMLGAKLTHVLSDRSYYEVFAQYNSNKYNTHQMPLRDTTKKYEPIPGYKVDESPFGYWGYSETSIDGMITGGWMNLGRDKSKNSTFNLKFDFTSQINMRNEIKTGFQFTYNDYNINSFTSSPSMGTWNRSLKYHVSPYRFGMYIQDKIEFEGFIANVGVRLDYSDPNTHKYVIGDYDKMLQAGYGNLIEEKAPESDTKPKWKLSPRLGVSHPITENSKLYFNYGHFLQEPGSSYRFRLQRESNGLVTYMGNPDMTFQKTIAYEIGYSHNLFNMFLFNIAGYYKDVTDQPGWVYYQSINNQVQYYKATNNNYEDIRGLEITLSKNQGKWITGFINYTYDVHTSGYFGLTRYYEDPNKQRDYLRLNPYQEKPRPQPYARANIDFHTPNKFGPKLGSVSPLERINLNLLVSWRAGSYSTYNPHQLPGVKDNIQWRDYFNVDARFIKSFKIKKYDIQFFVDIKNIFNLKYLSYAGFADQYDYYDYLESLRFSWEEGDQHGNDRVGDYRPNGVPYDPLEPNPNNDPEIAKRNKERIEKKSYINMPNIKSMTFLNPRRFIVGLRITF